MIAHPADSPPPVSAVEPLRDGQEPGGTGARTCKNCLFWTTYFEGSILHKCENPKLNAPTFADDSIVIVHDDRDPILVTGQHFGCIHFTARGAGV